MTLGRHTKFQVVGAIVTGLATILGILADAPLIIRDHIRRFPEWIQNPNIVWAICLAAIYGLVVLIIWNPFRCKPPRHISEFAERLELFTTGLGKIVKKHRHLIKIRPITELDAKDAARLVEDIKRHVPLFLQTNFGKDEFERYKRFMSVVTGTEPRQAALEVVLALLRYFGDFLNRQMRTLVKHATDITGLQIAELQEANLSETFQGWD